jgi:hypothetical protein
MEWWQSVPVLCTDVWPFPTRAGGALLSFTMTDDHPVFLSPILGDESREAVQDLTGCI